MEEFNRTASVVATNIQKLVQNVSSMQRMLVHVESQVTFCNFVAVSFGSYDFFLIRVRD